MNYQSKYLKYKAKYFRLKVQTGGMMEAASSSSSSTRKKWAIMVFGDIDNYNSYQKYNSEQLNNEFEIFPIDQKCVDAPNCMQLHLPDDIDKLKEAYFDMISFDEDTLYWINFNVKHLHTISAKLTDNGIFYLPPDIRFKANYGIKTPINADNEENLKQILKKDFLQQLFIFKKMYVTFYFSDGNIKVNNKQVDEDELIKIQKDILSEIIPIWLKFYENILTNFFTKVEILKDKYPSPKNDIEQICIKHGYIKAYKPKKQKDYRYLIFWHKAIASIKGLADQIFVGNEMIRHYQYAYGY